VLVGDQVNKLLIFANLGSVHTHQKSRAFCGNQRIPVFALKFNEEDGLSHLGTEGSGGLGLRGRRWCGSRNLTLIANGNLASSTDRSS
jgi:hypothetical protein